jgi:hypothetical protein
VIACSVPRSYRIVMPSSPPTPAARTGGTQHDGRTWPTRTLASLSARDRAIVLAVARLRILAYDQVRTLLFPDRHPSVLTRRVHALVAEGWLTRWRARGTDGGAPSYILPTARALALALDALRHDAADTAYASLVDRMLPERPRKPLVLRGRTEPPFLAHQREVNQLVVASLRCAALDVRWASSFERPFGRGADATLLPQPDYVLVLHRAGIPVVVLGEHDRGQESLAHFRRAKAERYAPYALLPELAAATFGAATVEVWLTVTDPVARRPERRLRQLAAVMTSAGAAPITRVALAGRAYTDPAGAWRNAALCV